MIQKKSDDAISPVIGVMLMLVVTVVIAAAVTIFATGVVGETEAAPVATLNVEILSNQESLEGLNGPELFITHVSGEAVDTRDIELRFSWTHDGCSHYSTYSAEGFEKSGIDFGQRKQPLYVKSYMDVQREYEDIEYGSFGLNHFFGDVILTPGLKLSANSEFLSYGHNTQSKFMDVIFDNYKISTKPVYSKKTHSIPKGTEHDGCWECMLAEMGWREPCAIGKSPEKLAELDAQKNAYANGQCYTCGHAISICEADTGFNCACSKDDTSSAIIGYDGIMNHLQPGTAVDVMIVHLPSNKAIYDKTVIVQ